MNNPAQISVVVPVFNMGSFLPDLLKGLELSGVYRLANEILIVDDGSTDNSTEVVEKLALQFPKIHLLPLGRNQGRYMARLQGAESAKCEQILFIDARVVLAPDFAEKMSFYLLRSNFLQPQTRLDTHRNIFCLYWDRSHRAIFRHHYRNLAQGTVELNQQNYDQFLKGTTAVVMPRQLFLNVCKSMGQNEVLSDDTAIMKQMVHHQPLLLTPDLWFWWVPREELAPFLWRLYDRGPGLVEYHVFQSRGWIFASILCGLLLLILWIVTLIHSPADGLKLLGFILLFMAISTAFIAKSVFEFLRLAPLHVAVLFAVGFGILKGLVVNTRRWIKGELKRLSHNHKLS